MKNVFLSIFIYGIFSFTLGAGVKSNVDGSRVYHFPANQVEFKGGAHLFILSGQSNMAALDPDVSFTPAVVKAFGKESVIVVKHAMGGQPIARWYKDWKSVKGKESKFKGDLYDSMIVEIKKAIKGRELKSVTYLWMQGEHDASRNQVAVYKKSLDGMLKQLKQDLKRDDINFVIGRLSDFSLDTGKHPEWQKMRDLQVAYADSSKRMAWVNTDDLNNKIDRKTGKEKNDVHYTKAGYKEFGKRLAETSLKIIANHK